MRVLIVGAGAVGGFFGASLIRAGRDVTFLVRAARAEQLARDGVVVRDAGQETTTPVSTITTAQITAPFDLVIASVKEQALESAIADVAPAVGPQSCVLPLLNGMRHLDRLTEAFGSAVLGGVAVVASQLGADGAIDLLGPDRFMRYGELSGEMTDRIADVDRTLAGAGFDTVCSDRIVTDMWDKWIFLASAAALTTMLRANVGEVTATEFGPTVAAALIDECASVAIASGITVAPEVVAGARSRLIADGSPFTASLYRDMIAGRDLESDSVVTDLVRRADRLSVSVPLLTAASVTLSLYRRRR
ncbi:2-dehydropantoate 2-reductase [Williamsia sp.]|uniref:2-dehydropantoate 2-reductase n=1 Tax=Williamsia sp. TaxID=1872085 RepID=UPI001A1F1283|nr:2-dehydropantoate 2-reductase [Williamsia sp.]MBJ7289589.1 2-dehydropantoate 2-reductase [Williamsia sp.]